MEANKLNKKLKRKLLQLSQKLSSDCRLIVSNVPTVFVLVGNGGLSAGVSNDLLMVLLKSTTALLDSRLDETVSVDSNVVCIHTAPNCDSPIIEFKDVESAEIVLRKMNGHCVQDLINSDLRSLAPEFLMRDAHPPLHLLMAYVSAIPSIFHGNKDTETVEPATFPSGCCLLDNFISEDEEMFLLKYFSFDFTKIIDSLRQCKEWEQSMRNELEGISNTKTEDTGLKVDDLQEENKPMQDNSSSTRDTINDKILPNNSSQFTRLKLRTVHHYGYEFMYGVNTVDPSRPLPGGLPPILHFLIERIMRTGLLTHAPDQLTVNEYEPGAGIPRHVDTHSAFKDGICIVTLGSQTMMQFQSIDGRKVDVVLPRRSLFIMNGESRYLWTHCIPPRKFDIVSSSTLGMESLHVGGNHFNHLILQRFIRVSLTLRKIHCSPCVCDYPELCDSRA